MTNDITALLYRIKDNIQAIENENFTEDLLGEVCADFLEMIELIKLFLISERDSYYGYFLMNMQFKADVYLNSIAGIKLNTFPLVFAANPLLLCKFSLKEILYIVCHEIDHVVLNHPAEMVKTNPENDEEKFFYFNLAADAAVNDRINYEIKKEKHNFLKKPRGVITSGTLSKMFKLGRIPEMESYAYYFGLINSKEKTFESSWQNGSQFMLTEQEHNGWSQKAGESDSSENGVSEDGKKVVTAKNCAGKIEDHNWEAGNDAEDAAAAVKEFVNAAVGMMREESRGLMPGYFMSQVEIINKPPTLSWQKILKKYVGTITANKRKTKMRLNRRQPERFDLSGTVDEKVLKIVVAIDTSGSVEDSMIDQIFNEIFVIISKRKHDITVIECDAQVQRVYKAKTKADIKLKVAGRGGTWFTPAIEYINNDRYFRDALLIYFTDGYGEDEIPKPKTYRNLWVIIGGAQQLSVKEPYGAVLSL